LFKNLTLKNIAAILLFMIYFSSNIILFSIFNSSYVEKIKGDLIEQNKYSLEIARNAIFKEIDTLLEYGKQMADDQIVKNAFANNKYVSVRYDNVEEPIKITTFNKMAQIKMAAELKNKFFGWQEGKIRRDITFYDSNLTQIVTTGDSPYNREVLPKYLVDSMGTGYNPGTEIGVIESNGEEIILKASVPIHRTKHLGIVEVSEKLNSVLVNEIKGMVNREIIIKNSKRVITSTIYGESGLVENYSYTSSFFNKKKDAVETEIGGKKLIFNFYILNDYEGKTVAEIGTGYYVEPFEKIYKETLYRIILYELLFSIILLIVIYVLLTVIFRPLNKIVGSIKNISDGHYQDKVKVGFGYELKVLSGAVNNLADAVEIREKELKELNTTLEEKVEIRTSELIQSNRSLKILLDNTGQGILFFESDLEVDSNYSSECIRFFSGDISGENVAGLLFRSEYEKKFFKDTITTVFMESNKRRAKAYIELLPIEVELNEIKLKIEYRIIESEIRKIMLILTDITEIKKLENRIKDERNRLNMIVKVVVNAKYFLKTVSEFKNYILKLETHKINNLKEEFMSVHTYKGNFSQLMLLSLSKELNKFEDEIQKSIENKVEIEEYILKERIEKVKDKLESEIETVSNILGKEFFTEKTGIVVSIEKMQKIEEQLKKILPVESYIVFKEKFGELRNIRLYEMIKRYENYVKEIAERKSKKVKFEIYEIDTVYVDEEKYNEFVNSLVHVFRNMIDHGIELPEERVNAGKREEGVIKCSIRKDGNRIQIYISDDGTGLDYKKIYEKAVISGLIKSEQETDTDYLTKIIFEENFSTKDNSDDISGRGVGLAAVKKVVEENFGNIEVLSERGKGSEFRITVLDRKNLNI
jgi:two-component system, chemotaxis family, sensor kinase CheA